MERVNLNKSAPEAYQTMAKLDGHIQELCAAAGIPKGFSHLLRLRASQINGCAYCLKMHARDSLAAGESGDRIGVLPAWRETELFEPKERAALALVESITQITEGHVPDSVYEEATSVLSDKEILAVEWLAVAMNAWNRIAISSRTRVKP